VIGVRNRSRIFSATVPASAGDEMSKSRIVNSSPPGRATVSSALARKSTTPRNFAQQFIADFVPQRIVDPFELVEIGTAARPVALSARCACAIVVRGDRRTSAVREVRQRVVERHAFHPL
jgi:hypothetical protein